MNASRLYRLYDLATGHKVVPALRLLEARQRWGADAVAADATHRLRRLLLHARSSVPYYRQLIDDTKELELASLPLLSRNELSNHAHLFFADRTSRRSFRTVSSGGSTGTPVTVYLDRETLDMHSATTLRHHSWMGLDLICRNLLLWGPPPGVVGYGTLRGRLRGIFLRRRFVHTWKLNTSAVASIRKLLHVYQPELVVGYVSALDSIAAGAEPVARPARAVVAAGELMTPAQRRRIVTYFRAPVYERYGSNEFSAIAHDCRNGRLHLNSDRLIVEILHPDGRPAIPGEIGEVVLTDLDNYGMPLIRYRLGDAAEPDGPCSCGLPFPTIRAIHGRINDLVLVGGNRLISPRQVAITLELSGDVLEHQLRIGSDHSLHMDLRAAGRIDLERARHDLEALFEAPVAVGLSKQMERWPSGKIRFVLREDTRT